VVINKLGTRQLFIVSAFVALLAGMFALVTAGTASAQDMPAICDEYPNNPECDVRPEPPDEDPDPNELPSANVGGSGGGNGDGDGALPFTGYPLTGLILLLLILLATGLVIRGGTALRERFARGASAP